MKRPDKAQLGSTTGGKPVGGFISELYPLLWTYLTDDTWDDGKPRERSTLMLICEGGVLKVWLNDKALRRSVWVTGESPEDAMGALEQGLRDECLPWRPAAQQGHWRGKK